MDEAPERNRLRASRIALLVAPAAAFIALLTYGVIKAPAAPPQVGDKAPSFSAPLLSGAGSSSLTDHR
ncbi:MAG TPA: hypothetical protein VFS38_07040, partial [Actinomycetota bacterium]|nr:hypothetical protein [Actinomycetota bacterium]